MIIGASMEVYPSISKAALSDTDGSLTWQERDTIAVATTEGHQKFGLKTGAETASATFGANYSGTLGSYATYPADIFDSESIIKIPASREWSEGNTNCSMFGSVDGDNVAFKHLGGVVKVTLNGVPADAKKFVFSTPGKKITGEFDINNVSETDTDKCIKTSEDNGNANSSYTLNFTLEQAQNMAFYIPLPCGTYPKFAFKLLGADESADPLYEFEGISAQTVNRKDILLMPASTIGTVPDGGYLLTSVPSEKEGEYFLPEADSVILYFEGKQTLGTDDVINLKYNGSSQLPKKLCLKVKNGNKVNISGELPNTHVEFDQGEIVTAELKTSATTFKIIAPAKISEKLVVKGGNVEIIGEITDDDNVKAIEVETGATADDSSAPVQITIAEDATVGTSGTGGGITTRANVVIVNNTTQEVKVTVPESAQETVQVASAGTGSGGVKKNDEVVTTKPAAAIGTQNFITLSDAVNAIPQGNDQTVTINILENIVLKALEALTINKNNVVLDGQNHTITLDETDTNLDKYKKDGDNKKYGSFQMIKVTGNDVVLRNLTLDSKDYRGVSLATTWGGRNATYQNIVYNGKGSGHYYGYAASEGTLTFIGCTFNTCGYAIHTAESTTDLVVTNCNIDGWVSYGDKTKSATFTNCNFNKAEDKHNKTLATVRPYCGTTFTGCSFSSDYLTDSKYTGITVRHNVVVSLKNCTVDGGENLYELANITNPDDAWVDGGVLAIDATGDATAGFTAGTFVAKQASDIKAKSGYAPYAIEGKTNVYRIREVEAVAKIGSVKYETLDAAFAAVQAGQTIEIVKAGSYAIPSPINNITVKGADNLVTAADEWGTHPTVVFSALGAKYGESTGKLSGTTFENIKFAFSGNLYTGFQHQEGIVTFKKCDLDGYFNSYGDMLFDSCTFNQTAKEYSMWCYAGNVTYKNCTINCNGKFVNAYNEGNALKDGQGNRIPWKVVAEGCTFNSTTANKAALNIKATCGDKPLYYDVEIKNCTANGENWPVASTSESLVVGSALWQVDDIKASVASKIKVTVDDTVVYTSPTM